MSGAAMTLTRTTPIETGIVSGRALTCFWFSFRAETADGRLLEVTGFGHSACAARAEAVRARERMLEGHAPQAGVTGTLLEQPVYEQPVYEAGRGR